MTGNFKKRDFSGDLKQFATKNKAIKSFKKLIYLYCTERRLIFYCNFSMMMDSIKHAAKL